MSDEESSNADPKAEIPDEGPGTVIPEEERDALLTIAHGAVVTSGGVSLERGLTTLIEFLLARGLGPVTYGIYALGWRISQLLVQLVTFGSVPALQRFIPAYSSDPDRRSRTVGLAYATTLGFGLLLALAVWTAAPLINDLTVEHPEFPATMRLFGLLIVLIGLVMVAAGTFRAVGSARGEVLFNRILYPGARLAGVLVALAAGYSVVGIVGAIVASMAVLVVIGVPMTVSVTGIRPAIRGLPTEAFRFYNHAGPVAMSSLGKVFQNRIDLLLVGALLTATAAGIYNVVLVLIAIAWIPLLSFNQLLPPIASDLYSNDRMTTLNAIYTSVTRLIVTCVVPLLTIQLVFGRELLGVFGPTYVEGYVPLAVYLVSVFVGSAVGATGWLLMMTDHQYARMILDWLLAVLNVSLTYAFILRFGLVGAALGTALAISVQNSLQVLLLCRFEGLWPFDATFLKPIGAGLAMAAVMYAVRIAGEGLLVVVLGTGIGAVVYAGCLAVLGPDPRDRFVVRTLASQYRAQLGELSR